MAQLNDPAVSNSSSSLVCFWFLYIQEVLHEPVPDRRLTRLSELEVAVVLRAQMLSASTRELPTNQEKESTLVLVVLIA